MNTKRTGLIVQNEIFLWVAAATAFILSIPLIAMQFTNEVDWNIGDFAIIGTLLFGSGSLFVLLARRTPQKYRILIGAAILLLVVWIWAELAVGIFTNLGS